MNPEKILILIITGTAMLMDLRYSSIDNGWILISALCGIVYRSASLGVTGFLQSAAGIFIAFSLLLLLFIFRMLGAGDIKLLCALGAVLGPSGSLRCIAGSFLCGAVIAVPVMLSSGILHERIRYLKTYLYHAAHTGKPGPYRKPGMNRPENIHFTIPVFIYVSLLAALPG